jgi:hypothetical protein
MCSCRPLSVVVLVAVATSWPGAVCADPVPMSAGLVPVPQESTEVALVSEDLSVDVHFSSMDVVAKIVLENRGKAASLQVGFPCLPSTGPETDPETVGLSCDTKIAVKVDGVAQKLTRKKTSPEEHHWVWPMRFEPAKPVALEVRYTQRMVNERYGIPVQGMGALTYRLSTGARWAGPIQRLDMEVRLPVETVLYATPPGFTREPGRIRWSLASFDPKGDLAILFAPYETMVFLGAFRAKTYPEYLKLRNAGLFDGEALKKLAGSFAKGHGPEGMYGEALNLFKIFRPLRGLPVPDQATVGACAEESAKLIAELAAQARPAKP